MRIPTLTKTLTALLVLALVACPRPSDDDDDTVGDDDDDTIANLCEGIDTVSGTEVAFESFATGLNFPLGLVAHPTDASVLLVLQQGGQVVRFRDGARDGTFIDISSRVTSGGEAGLLGMAFAPDFASSGNFYLHYDTPGGGGAGFQSTISEFSVASGDEATGDPDSERVLLQVGQPASNHNGGSIEFGPDGMLYIGLGDGGGGGDTYCTGSDGSSLLAKILRIDPTPSGSAAYTVPADNPFVGDASVVDETWAWGLRNPWRFSFDRETGQMWIADVGQNAYEEIDIGEAGAHYGWSAREGAHNFSSSCSNQTTNLTEPYFEYRQTSGGSITGGYVYRGCKMPDLHGQYFFADAVTGQAWRIPSTGATTSTQVWSGQGFYELVSFGEDQTGELYVTKLFSGEVWKIVPAG